MGREANCKCDWAGATVNVKALLETSELILRGEIRKRIPFGELKELKAQAGRLCFSVAGEPVQLYLGAAQAEKWAATLKAGPAPLARKLGITGLTIVRTIGPVQDEALQSALAQASQIPAGNPDLVVACVETPQDLAAAIKSAKSQISKSVPIWIVYPKGPGKPLNESLVRTVLLAKGMVDTKVAAVSARLTAIRFNARRGNDARITPTASARPRTPAAPHSCASDVLCRAP